MIIYIILYEQDNTQKGERSWLEA